MPGKPQSYNNASGGNAYEAASLRTAMMKKRSFQEDQGMAAAGAKLAANDTERKSEVVTSEASPGGNIISSLPIGSTDAGVAGGILSGAATGAAIGAPIGGAGAAVGAGIGVTIGTIGAIAANKAKRKALARQIEGQKNLNIAAIQQNAGQAESMGLQNMIAGLRSSFLR